MDTTLSYVKNASTGASEFNMVLDFIAPTEMVFRDQLRQFGSFKLGSVTV